MKGNYKIATRMWCPSCDGAYAQYGKKCINCGKKLKACKLPKKLWEKNDIHTAD